MLEFFHTVLFCHELIRFTRSPTTARLRNIVYIAESFLRTRVTRPRTLDAGFL